MTGWRLFTIAEVNALIPKLSDLVGQQMTRHGEIAQHLADLAHVTGDLPSSLVEQPRESELVRKLKRELRLMIERYAEGWTAVRALGGVVKDPQVGTIDFYSSVEGRFVWLSWRHGEESVGFYHELDAGCAGRRPLRSDVLDRSLN
ncbi:MAG: DUF2203 domain-containing protein [Polyangiaceae bacterium]|nr:DUF2203 domain-containing protein [Polyangiaceae bacterium]